MPDKVIDIPNVGRVAFPDSMGDDEINAAAGKLYAEKNAQHPPPDPSHSWIDTAVDWLPTAGGIVGGIAGGIGGTAFGMGIGGVPGSIGGAGLGGAAGEGAKQTINALRGKPLPTMKQGIVGMAKEAAMQGGAEAVGGVIGAVAKPVAEAVMQSALKPGIKYTMRSALKGETAPVVKTLLDEGVNVSQRGVQKLTTLLDATDDEIAAAIKGVTADVNPYKVTAKLGETARVAANQVNPASDLEAVSRVGQEFLAAHPNLTVQEAQALKRGTYKQLGDKAYTGELKGAEVEAQKALARGLKDQIEEEVGNSLAGFKGKLGLPGGVDIGALNAREGALIEARKALARRVAVGANNNPMGLASLAISHPTTFLATLIDRGPVVKSLIARGMYAEAGRAAKVSPQLIKVAVRALVSGAPDTTEPQ